MAEFVSPQIPIPQLSESLTKVGLNVSQNDFTRPDPRRWRDIYSQMYEKLTKVPIEVPIQSIVMREVRLKMNHPDLYEEAGAQLAFVRLMQRVMSGCGYPSFSLRDVVQPSTATVQKVASVFINRTLHDCNVAETLEGIRESAIRSRGENENVIKKNTELKSFFEADDEQHVYRKAEQEKLKGEIEKFVSAKVEVVESTEEEQEKCNKLKTEISELEYKKATLKQEINQKSQQNESISKKIVQSPKKFQVELDRLKRSLVEKKMKYAQQEHERMQSRQLMEETAKKIDSAEKSVKFAKETQAELNMAVEINTELNGLEDKLVELQDQFEKNSKQEEDLREIITQRKGRKFTLTNQTDQRQHNDLQKATDLKKYTGSLEAEIKSTMAEISANKDEEAKYKQHMSEIDSLLEKPKEDMQKEEERLLEQVNQVDEIYEMCVSKMKKILN